MSNSIRLNVSAGGRALLAFAALAALCSHASAQQTAPQLLPYSVKVIAGGGPTWTPTTGGTCPVSGNTSTDAYGDGCLATEITLTGPRAAVTDVDGNVFFTDYTNGLIRRVDAITGVVTAVAGGVTYSASPQSGAYCSGTSGPTATDNKGDGCLGTQVFLEKPVGLVISPAGDLYFTELGGSAGGSTYEKIFGADVRKIAATGGLIPATASGVISTVAGAASSYYYYGYSANPATCTPSSLATCIYGNSASGASASYLNDPYGLAFDNKDDLYINDEDENAVLVLNLSAITNTLFSGNENNEVVIPAGTIAKIAGASTADGAYCPNGDTSPFGCNYATSFTIGDSANTQETDGPYSVAVGPTGNVYFVDYYTDDAAEVPDSGTSADGNIYLYAGVQDAKGTITAPVTTRGDAGTFDIGAVHGVAADSNSNVYITDSTNGVVWRVDGAHQVPGQLTQPMYPVAGGASTLCTTSIVPGVTTIDTWGDGCAATSAKFGTGTTAGIFDVSVDADSDLFVGDTVTGLVREVASGTQFGPIGANQPVQYIDIHFAAGDSPASSSPYTLTAGASNFSLGTASCTRNSDTTEDCVIAVTATPSVLGPFTGTLEVNSELGGTSSFPLSGTFVATPLTRTVVTAAQAANCTNTTAYNPTTPVTLTATIFYSGANPPTGTVIFYANGSALNPTAPAAVSENTATGAYAASITYTFSTTGSYAITAIYTPTTGSYYDGSTSAADNITSSTPSLSPTAITYQQGTVSPGQTALYSFNLQQNVYTGTITFSCSSLPANSSCLFNPSSFTANGCQTSNTVALSILTQGPGSVNAASFGSAGRGPWAALSLLSGIGLALLIGVRRRRIALRQSGIWMALALLLATLGIASCNGAVATPATPAGTYTVTVTATGSTGTTSSFPVTLIVQ